MLLDCSRLERKDMEFVRNLEQWEVMVMECSGAKGWKSQVKVTERLQMVKHAKRKNKKQSNGRNGNRNKDGVYNKGV